MGGYNADKVLTPFLAAYSTVDTYLSSLPDGDKYIDECANLYSNNIVNFGLCDVDELNKISSYQSNVASGISTSRIDNTDYSNNDNIVINHIPFDNVKIIIQPYTPIPCL